MAQNSDDVITRLKHPAVAEARRRLQESAFLADGHRLVGQALDAGARVESAFFIDPVEDAEEPLLQTARAADVACHLVSRGVFFRLLGLGYETSVRVLAVVSRPALRPVTEFAADDACILLGERIQDPRNVGVMVRTADAWNLSACAFTSDSADPWSRAGVRSTTGSIFRVPVTLCERMADDLERLRAMSLRVIGTSAHASSPCWEADLTGPCAVILGNESVGISDELAHACDQMVSIPMWGGAHSLNVTVAAGILLYERARQLRLKE